MATESSPNLGACTVTIDCADTDVKLHVTAPGATAASAGSHEFAPASKKVAGRGTVSMSGSFIGDPATMPATIEQQLQEALDTSGGIDPQWHKIIHRYGTAQYSKIRVREQFRRVLEARHGHGHDHIDAPAPTGPSHAGSRNTGSKTGHSGMTRRSGER